MEEKKYPIGGYAPGNYQCRCCDCGEVFIGDKRAVQCEPCAVAAKQMFDALSPAEQDELINRNAEAVKDMLSKWNKPASFPPLGEQILTDEDVKDWERENKCICNEPYDSEKHEGGYPACPVHDKRPEINHDRVIANQLAGMPLEEAIFQDGYSAGVDFEKKRRKPGSVWVKASERLPANDMTDDFPCEYALKCKNDGDRGQVIYESGNCADIAHMLQTSGYDVIYWLDESGAAPSVEISQDAHEKEVMMNAFNEVRRIFEGRVWIMEGRGSYPYNDDRYREEVRYMYNEFDELHKNTWANIKSHSSEYRQAIIEQYLKEKGESAPSGEREVAFAEWCGWDWRRVEGKSLWENQKTLEVKKTAELYEIFKQKKEKR